MTIRAIETDYAGCRFRSRLEARWAVFFDALGIEWLYEPQGFDLDGDRYLPDFYLTQAGDRGTWVEVKGDPRTVDVVRLANAALRLPATPESAAPEFPIDGVRLLVLGEVPARPALHYAIRATDTKIGWSLTWQNVAFISLRHQRAGGYVPVGWSDGLRPSEPVPETWPNLDLDGMLVDPLTERAYRAARSARFEFGQSGALVDA